MKKIVLGRSSPSGIAFIIINVALIVGVIIAFIVGIGFLSMTGLLFLGAIQLISALKGAISGSLIKRIYFGVSISFLVIYFGFISDYFAIRLPISISTDLLFRCRSIYVLSVWRT